MILEHFLCKLGSTMSGKALSWVEGCLSSFGKVMISIRSIIIVKVWSSLMF